MSERMHLPGGSGGVWYADDPQRGPVVHRPSGPWTPAVHELLSHLAARGLEGLPRVVGTDDAGLEVLTFLPGRSIDVNSEEAPDDVLIAAARWLRRFHDAVRDFRPEGPTLWRGGAATLGVGEIICHNDPGAYNWVIDGGAFAGMIDWDQAGPGHPLDDLAFLCWTGVPLFRAIPTADAARRVRLATEAYAGVEACDVLDAAAARLLRSVERISAGIERGDPGMLALRDRGEPDATRARVEAFLDRVPAIRTAL